MQLVNLEVFPMTIPDGVTLRGTNLRSTSVKPTSVTNNNNAFILSGDAHISDLTIKISSTIVVMIKDMPLS